MSFSGIPVRSNGQKADASWWNLLRTAGVLLEGFFGSGFISETSFNLTNNQGSAANITGLLFDKTVTGSAVIQYTVYRYSTGLGGQERRESGLLLVGYRATANDWRLTRLGSGPDDAGIDFSITSAGQVQYQSDDNGGTAQVKNKIQFSASTLGVA